MLNSSSGQQHTDRCHGDDGPGGERLVPLRMGIRRGGNTKPRVWHCSRPLRSILGDLQLDLMATDVQWVIAIVGVTTSGSLSPSLTFTPT
jgi:hypothetical protein